MKKTLIDFSQHTFSDVFDEHTKKLVEREAKHNKWLNKDGSKKKNYYWKYASKTKQGDAGESVVCTTLILVLKKIYGNGIKCSVVNKGKGEFDLEVYIQSENRTITFEVKTATEDVNGSHQFNGLKKDVNYDFAFLFGVAPEDFFFKIESKQYLCENMTTNMSKDVEGSYKHTLSQTKLLKYTPQNLYDELLKKVLCDSNSWGLQSVSVV
jgi:hypothetical protein